MKNVQVHCLRISEKDIPKNGGPPSVLKKFLTEHAACNIIVISEHYLPHSKEFVFFIKYNLPS